MSRGYVDRWHDPAEPSWVVEPTTEWHPQFPGQRYPGDIGIGHSPPPAPRGRAAAVGRAEVPPLAPTRPDGTYLGRSWDDEPDGRRGYHDDRRSAGEVYRRPPGDPIRADDQPWGHRPEPRNGRSGGEPGRSDGPRPDRSGRGRYEAPGRHDDRRPRHEPGRPVSPAGQVEPGWLAEPEEDHSRRHAHPDAGRWAGPQPRRPRYPRRRSGTEDESQPAAEFPDRRDGELRERGVDDLRDRDVDAARDRGGDRSWDRASGPRRSARRRRAAVADGPWGHPDDGPRYHHADRRPHPDRAPGGQPLRDGGRPEPDDSRGGREATAHAGTYPQRRPAEPGRPTGRRDPDLHRAGEPGRDGPADRHRAERRPDRGLPWPPTGPLRPGLDRDAPGHGEPRPEHQPHPAPVDRPRHEGRPARFDEVRPANGHRPAGAPASFPPYPAPERSVSDPPDRSVFPGPGAPAPPPPTHPVPEVPGRPMSPGAQVPPSARPVPPAPVAARHDRRADRPVSPAADPGGRDQRLSDLPFPPTNGPERPPVSPTPRHDLTTPAAPVSPARPGSPEDTPAADRLTTPDTAPRTEPAIAPWNPRRYVPPPPADQPSVTPPTQTSTQVDPGAWFGATARPADPAPTPPAGATASEPDPGPGTVEPPPPGTGPAEPSTPADSDRAADEPPPVRPGAPDPAPAAERLPAPTFAVEPAPAPQLADPVPAPTTPPHRAASEAPTASPPAAPTATRPVGAPTAEPEPPPIRPVSAPPDRDDVRPGTPVSAPPAAPVPTPVSPAESAAAAPTDPAPAAPTVRPVSAPPEQSGPTATEAHAPVTPVSAPPEQSGTRSATPTTPPITTTDDVTAPGTEPTPPPATGDVEVTRPGQEPAADGADGLPDPATTAGPDVPRGEQGDPEQVLASYRWELDPVTLRESVADPARFRTIRHRLTEKLGKAVDNKSRARLLSLRAVVSRIVGDLDDALADGRLALTYAEATAELRRTALAQARLAHVLRWRGEYAEADRLFAEANSPELPDRLRAALHEHAGRCCFDQGRLMEACVEFERALNLRGAADPDLLTRVRTSLDAVAERAAAAGFGPYPRSRTELLEPDRPPVPARDGERWGFADPGGDLVIAAEYAQAQPFHEGVAWVRRPTTDRWSLIDLAGATVLEPSWPAVRPFSDGLAWVSHGEPGGWQAVDQNGGVAVSPGFAETRPFRRGVAAVRREGWGAVDRTGRLVVPTRYHGFATTLANGRHIDGFTDEGLAVMDVAGRYGVVDRTGRMVVPPVHPALAIHPVAFLVAVSTGRWGALDRRGEPLIDPVHRDRDDVLAEIDRLLTDTMPVL
ncbi:WG repeat-containing protein [Micromonospora sp. WMMA1363]|uniref:WG repeat-containing protein n=1 Tax=Micromonospora sp. WMMA1363 TaxID=3053985 RepID=UPI00259CD16E|nr:WG repeat-containing protein [Micromonospora sp. WMMA1363]MDM4720077.1 WG repeat-containing protein [Micromonospora sp. WMMA1363]